jgi:methionine sulfoxide reductase heme-binding subunit
VSHTLDTALWWLGRGTGVMALVMFTISVVLGILTRSGRSVSWLPRFAATDLHRTAALTGTTLVGIHVGSLLFDPYAQLRLADLVIPFGGAYRPLWLGLGTAAVDLLLAVVVTSLLRHRIGPRLFRLVHWATYALWPVALLHGLGTGTDAATLWFRGIAVGCAAAVLGALAWRTSPSFGERGWRRIPRKAVS